MYVRLKSFINLGFKLPHHRPRRRCKLLKYFHRSIIEVVFYFPSFLSQQLYIRCRLSNIHYMGGRRALYTRVFLPATINRSIYLFVCLFLFVMFNVVVVQLKILNAVRAIDQMPAYVHNNNNIMYRIYKRVHIIYQSTTCATTIYGNGH